MDKKHFGANKSVPSRKLNIMSGKNKKQFGVWMDTHHATIVGREHIDHGDFKVLGHVNNDGAESNSSENAANHQEMALTHKFFKQIAAIMVNVDELHLTGTGKIQEEFRNFLAETPQYKHTVTTDSTSNKVADEHLVALITNHFH